METEERYTGGHIGSTRELTESERQHLARASEGIASKPPWTPKRMRGNTEFRETLIKYFEDGVSTMELAEALNWGLPRVAMHLRKAKEEGLGVGSRRYIPTIAETTDNTIKREISDRETEELYRLYNIVPQTSTGGGLRWTTREAKNLLAYIMGLQDDNVSLASIADLIGLTRQALSFHLSKAAKHMKAIELGKNPDSISPRSITPSEAKRVKAKYDALPTSSNGAKVWSSQQGIDLIDEIVALNAKGVPTGSARKRTSSGRLLKTIETEGVDQAIGISSSVIGRMVSMRDRFAERIS